ncbi:MAG: DUF1569 domain-containing protein [bacterium]|nr:DUF1569 domain-containing protein [bacterium]
MSAAQTTRIDTTKVTNRRKVHFTSLDELLADAEQLVALDGQGRVQPLGNMSLGQALGHLALWMHSCIDGIPVDPPWFIRIAGRLLKRSILRGGLRPGVKLPPDAEKQLVPTPSITSSEGFNQLSTACARLRREGKRVPSPVFGVLTLEEWDTMHLRHAELHLSFMETTPV